MEEFYGKERSKLIKQKMSKSRKGKFAGKNSPWYGKKHTKEWKLKMSAKIKEWHKTHANPVLGKHWKNPGKGPRFGKSAPYYTRKTGWKKRKDLNNQFFRSTWEANFARILNYWKIPLEYEKTRFDLGDCTYCPDFKILGKEPYFVEVVGFFDETHKKKLGLFMKKYPNEKLQIISKIEYKDLKQEFSKKIKNWEFR